MCMLSHFSLVQLFMTRWTVACQVPLSMGFSRQEYCSGLAYPPPGESSQPRDLLSLLYWQAGSLPPGKPISGREFVQISGDSGGQRRLACYSPMESQSQTQLSNWTLLQLFNPKIYNRNVYMLLSQLEFMPLSSFGFYFSFFSFPSFLPSFLIFIGIYPVCV